MRSASTHGRARAAFPPGRPHPHHRAGRGGASSAHGAIDSASGGARETVPCGISQRPDAGCGNERSVSI